METSRGKATWVGPPAGVQPLCSLEIGRLTRPSVDRGLVEEQDLGLGQAHLGDVGLRCWGALPSIWRTIGA